MGSGSSSTRAGRGGRDSEEMVNARRVRSKVNHGGAKPGFICNHMPDYEVTCEEHLWHELSLLSSEKEFSVDWDKWSACIRKARV